MDDRMRRNLLTQVARQDIEYLRREYAIATDLYTLGDEASIKRARAIYERIFTPDALIRAVEGEQVNLSANGPLAWEEIVLEALAEYRVTQHLIGSQVATIDQLTFDENGGILNGKAHMVSYLHAWHVRAGAERDESVWVFLGNYDDRLVYNQGIGWQIAEMTLATTAQENRALGQE